VSYYVNGTFVETSTEGVAITIYPQPQVTLDYYVPHKILSGIPFKLGVTATNNGSGWARNLSIDSASWRSPRIRRACSPSSRSSAVPGAPLRATALSCPWATFPPKAPRWKPRKGPSPWPMP
ncbi:MAG TPA: hypothetical protein PLY08_08810, partial [Bacillota bacterium]|nr:hypothetical protein [Bacillota bacterium]